MPLLSLCVIVKDEAEFLRRCLSTYRPAVDEIIVVDTGSTDNSLAVAAAEGAQVFHIPWTGSFSDARNAALARATHPWITWADADDFIEPREAQKLRHLATTRPPTSAYGFICKNTTDGILGSEFYQARMVPNNPEVRFCYAIHEQLMPAINAIELPYVLTDIRVIHTGYSTARVMHDKQHRNLAIMETEYPLRTLDPAFLLTFASTLLHFSRPQEALAHLATLLALPDCPNHIRLSTLLLLAEYHLPTAPQTAQEYARAALTLAPQFPLAHYLLALSYPPTREPEAASHLRACINSPISCSQSPSDHTSIKLSAITTLATIYAKYPDTAHKVRELHQIAVKITENIKISGKE